MRRTSRARTWQLGEKLGRPDAHQQIKEAEAKLAEFDKQFEQATAESFGTNPMSTN